MDKKSLIRGFGFGVLFATVVMGITYRIEVSDSAVVKRAKELGMVYASGEQTESLSLRGQASEQPSPSPTATPAGKRPKSTAEASATPKTVAKEEDPKAKDEMESEKKRMEDEMKKAAQEFSIREGEWSSQVSRRLEEQKLISNAQDFDNYLERNGYGDDIKAGTFSISPSDSYEEIARKITTH